MPLPIICFQAEKKKKMGKEKSKDSKKDSNRIKMLQ